jgi:hemolysin III
MANAASHAAGIAFGAFALILCIVAASMSGVRFGIPSAVVYGVSLVAVYATSCIYHALPRCSGKRVLRVVDHCMIYSLIAGTYTPIAAVAIMPVSKTVGLGLLIFIWASAAVAITLTAIDMKRFSAISMLLYIAMGWCVLPFFSVAVEALTAAGFLWVLFGGIAYTIGAVLYGIGKKKRYMHSVFHGFVLLGSALQFVGVLLYVL